MTDDEVKDFIIETNKNITRAEEIFEESASKSLRALIKNPNEGKIIGIMFMVKTVSFLQKLKSTADKINAEMEEIQKSEEGKEKKH